ncbi:MAG: glycosyltransferase [Gammaproteobacteria bacterium]
MDISVIVCTFNRADNLPECVAHLDRQQGLTGVEWEVVIVDNNSTDDTADVVRDLQSGSTTTIRYVFEAEQGLSAARNRGIAEAASPYLCFIDDDIRVEPQWLRAVFDGFAQHSADAVGGRILVQTKTPLPAWINDDMRGFLGHRDFGSEPHYMDGITEFPFGGNMALSRRIIEQVGGFDTRMGRKGEGKTREELFKGEETDYFQRVAATGGRLYYAPDATVHHKILPHQLKKRFFRTIHFNAGYQRAMLDDTHYPRCAFRVPLFLFRQTVAAGVRYVSQLVTKGPSFAFRQQMNVGYFFGMIMGYAQRPRVFPAKTSSD